MVGEPLVFQTHPFAVMEAPLSDMLSPPQEAEFEVMLDTVLVDIEGAEAEEPAV